MVLLIAAFNFNWPESLQEFFDFSRPITQPFSEMLKLDCLFSSLDDGGAANKPALRLFYAQLIFLAFIPILFLMLAGGFWGSVFRCKRKQSTVSMDVDEAVESQSRNYEKSLCPQIIQTFTVLMYIATPNILQFMVSQFKCIDIDGENRLKVDLEIMCWGSSHTLFSYIVALPALIVWGAGLPLLAFFFLTKNRAQIAKGNDHQVIDSYGFLFGGYKSDFYFWEITLILRKIILIFVCIFVTNYGVMTQALIVLLVLVLFLVVTARKRPFVGEPLFDLEAISLATAIITAYCGLFFLADTSQIGLTNSDKTSEVTFALGDNTKRFLLSSIIGVNVIFFLYWIWRVISEMEALRGFILRSCPTLYLALFACGDRDQAYIDKQKQQVLDDNEGHKDEYMRMLRSMKQLYNRGDLLLNDAVMKRLRQFMNPEKILQLAGVVDMHDNELTKKIQAQLQNQYEMHEDDGPISQLLRSPPKQNQRTYHHSLLNDPQDFKEMKHKEEIYGSLLTEKEQPLRPRKEYNKMEDSQTDQIERHYLAVMKGEVTENSYEQTFSKNQLQSVLQISDLNGPEPIKDHFQQHSRIQSNPMARGPYDGNQDSVVAPSLLLNDLNIPQKPPTAEAFQSRNGIGGNMNGNRSRIKILDEDDRLIQEEVESLNIIDNKLKVIPGGKFYESAQNFTHNQQEIMNPITVQKGNFLESQRNDKIGGNLLQSSPGTPK